MRKYGRIDDNHRMIVRALRDIGCQVESLAGVGNGVPDVLALYHGELYLLEIKRDSKAKLTSAQEHFHSHWQSPNVAIVTCVEDALRVVGAIPEKNWKDNHSR